MIYYFDQGHFTIGGGKYFVDGAVRVTCAFEKERNDYDFTLSDKVSIFNIFGEDGKCYYEHDFQGEEPVKEAILTALNKQGHPENVKLTEFVKKDMTSRGNKNSLSLV